MRVDRLEEENLSNVPVHRRGYTQPGLLAEYHGGADGMGSLLLGGDKNARHPDWLELIDPDTKTFKPAAELRALLASKGTMPDREGNTYCGGGRCGRSERLF
jgi:3-mercaptopyruvate sulfurtransferase SseA